MRRYQSLIHDRVGRTREQLPDIKNIRVSPPEKYSGEDDIEKFNTWLAGLLRWYRVYNVTGNEKDTMRVDLCGTTLTDLAATWSLLPANIVILFAVDVTKVKCI